MPAATRAISVSYTHLTVAGTRCAVRSRNRHGADPRSDAEIDAAEPDETALRGGVDGKGGVVGQIAAVRLARALRRLVLLAVLAEGRLVGRIAQGDVDAAIGRLESSLLEGALQRARIALQEMQGLDPVDDQPGADLALVGDRQADVDAAEFVGICLLYTSLSRGLEHFHAKWAPVCVKKMRQTRIWSGSALRRSAEPLWQRKRQRRRPCQGRRL